MTHQLVSTDPATDEVVATFDVQTAEEVNTIVARAREASPWWRDQGYDGRRDALLRWKRHLAKHSEDLVQLMHRENGKPLTDARLELMLALEHIAWVAKHAGKVLRPEKRRPGVLLANFTARVENLPYGVVGVIGPWNYPIFTPNGSIATALAAGNTVVFKPSEYTPAIAQWYVDAFAAANPDAPDGVLSLVTGFGETGAALCRAGVDKLAFTGSAPTGRKVMAACAESLVPVVMELGGKDAAIVAADADLARAADAIAFGAMGNSGQTCVGIERVYVERPVRDAFLEELTERVRTIRPGSDKSASYGPMTMPSQIEIVRRHVDDALTGGGIAVVGGRESIGDRYIEPVVILDPPHTSSAVQEETFGPTVTVTTVESLDEAVKLANDTPFGLAGAVFSRGHAEEIVDRLETSQVSVNSVLGFAGMAALPLGGRGESGFGRIHGPEGLREFTRPRAVATQRFPAPINLLTFGRKAWVVRLLPRLIRWVHAR
ncbi:aldehyde dehydrogenase family protein [Nocardioides antri]|uniref:Aldehyde dehydrogenase n=1 Tax=Nocardioides antri TaxID=2607659 RepID=A0A5B1M0E0_9ACTN|nr:aldehyde dehydrogenase family protein [Nocardioides antri]KAA1426392.1 aldehyde dehydrogenase family protein [Nocardioides antri]